MANTGGFTHRIGERRETEIKCKNSGDELAQDLPN